MPSSNSLSGNFDVSPNLVAFTTVWMSKYLATQLPREWLIFDVSVFNRLAEEFLEHERGKLMSDWLSFKDYDPKKHNF